MQMLVLSRKNGQRVRLEVNGVVIWVTLIETGWNRAKLGFEAPLKDCVIAREELLPSHGSTQNK